MDPVVLAICCGLIGFIVGVILQSKRKETKKLPNQKRATSSTPKKEEGDHIPLKFTRRNEGEMVSRSIELYELANQRRSCRFFSSEEIPFEALENCIRVAGTSPSGAHTEPWTYVVVKDMGMKTKLREIVEQEEKENYARRMGVNWVKDLEKIGTDWKKPYLTECPAIVIFLQQTYGLDEQGQRITNHYYEISSAMSAGMFVLALHNAGLCTVTTTPLNAGKKIRELTNRPENEKVILLFPVGYPSDTATVPNLHRKELDKIMKIF